MDYKIKIINQAEGADFKQLTELIKESAIYLFVMRKYKLYNCGAKMRDFYINNHARNLCMADKEELDKYIEEDISFAKQEIKKNSEDYQTRYYAIMYGSKMIGFQMAQINSRNARKEGWRNFAYISPKYSWRYVKVIDTYGNQQRGMLSNEVYKNITKWFDLNNVEVEKTTTDGKAKKNVLTLVISKGFVPVGADKRYLYLEKDYSNLYSKQELKNIYNNYVKNNCMKQKLVNNFYSSLL